VPANLAAISFPGIPQLTQMVEDLTLQIEDKDTDIATNLASIGTLITELNTVEALVGSTSVASQITTAQTTLQAAIDVVAGDLVSEAARLGGLITSNDGDIATNLASIGTLITELNTVEALVGSTSVASQISTAQETLQTAIVSAVKAVSLVPTLSVFGSDLNDSVLDTAEAALVVRVGLSGVTELNNSVELFLNGSTSSPLKTATLDTTNIDDGYVQFTVTQAELGSLGHKQLTAAVSDGTVTSNESVGLFFEMTESDETAPSGATEFALTTGNTNNDTALDAGETITITFSEAVDVDTLVLGTQFAPNVLNHGDEAKLGYSYSVAATGGGSTATSFAITLGADTTANDLDLLVGTAAQRTLTFNKTAVVDAAGNPAASHIALIAPADIQKATAASTTHISTDVDATAAYATGETIRITFSEAVDTSLITMANLTSTAGTLGSSTIAAVNPTDGFATTFDITVFADASLAAANKISIDSSNVIDVAGNTGNGTTILFTLPTAFDSVLSAGTVVATDITTLAGVDGTGAIDASAVTTLTGTVAEISAAITAMGTTPTALNTTLSAGTVVATDITTIAAGDGTGVIDASAVTTLTGTVAQIDAAIAAAGTAPTNYATTLSAGTEAATDITTLAGVDGTGAIDASAVTKLMGTASEVVAVVDEAGITVAADYAVTLSGTANTSQLLTIAGDTIGTITAEDITDTPNGISQYSGTSARASAVLENATGTITAQGTGVSEAADFSGLLAGLTINSGGGNDTISGTAFADVITGGTGADELGGGGGSDLFVFNTGEAPTALVSILTYDKITDFDLSNDQIDFQVAPVIGAADTGSATLGGVSGTVSLSADGIATFTGDGAGDASLSEILAAVRTLVTGAGEIAVFEFNDGFNNHGTYVYQENGSSSNDLFVFMEGVTGVTDTNSALGDANTLYIY
jgi:hypothetical protein